MKALRMISIAARFALLSGTFIIAAFALAIAPAYAEVKVQMIKSPAGLEAWLVEEHSLPIFAISAAFRGGQSIEPVAKAGLSNLLSYTLDEGAGAMDSRAFMLALDEKAISFSKSSSSDYFSVSVSALTEHRDEALRLVGLALTKPRFDSGPVARMKDAMLVDIAQSKDSASTIAAEAWWAQGFPKDNYGRPENGSEATVRSLTPADLRAFHKIALSQDGLKIVIVGDMTAAEAGVAVDKLFGAIPKTGAKPPVTDVALSAAAMKVIEKDFPQSVVIFGLPGIKRDHPDFRALHVMNYVLGGGSFTSRLMQEIRVKRGLVYGVSTSLNNFARGGVWAGRFATKNESAGEAIAVLKAEVAKMRDAGITAEELADAKTYLTGSYVLGFDSNASIASQLLQTAIWNLGPDFINKRNKEVEAVTLDDIKRVAKKYLDPDRLVTVVVGQPKGLKP